MSGVSTEQDSSNKMNVDLNLVPFIDLLSTLTLFLLVTAVWYQVAAIPASVESSGKASVSNTPKPKLEVRVTKSGFQLSWPGSKQSLGLDFPKLQAVIKAGLNKNKLTMASVSADDNVDYSLVIQAIDNVKNTGFETVALSTD